MKIEPPEFGPTEAEMTAALTEFYQRGRGEVRPVSPPPPFEITSTVQSFRTPTREPELIESPPLVVPQRVLATEEKFYDFIPSRFYGFHGLPFRIGLEWFFRCHTEGSTAHNSYIRMYAGGFWQSITPPGYSGGLNYVFNQSTWFPPPFNTPGVWVGLTVYILNHPTGVWLTEARAYFACYIEEVGNPNNLSERIYPIGTIPDWAWYNANRGVGFIMTWHTL